MDAAQWPADYRERLKRAAYSTRAANASLRQVADEYQRTDDDYVGGRLGPFFGLGLARVSLSCGGEAWGHNGALTTDDGRFAALVTNGGVLGSRPVSIKVLDSALCEGVA